MPGTQGFKQKECFPSLPEKPGWPGWVHIMDAVRMGLWSGFQIRRHGETQEVDE